MDPVTLACTFVFVSAMTIWRNKKNAEQQREETRRHYRRLYGQTNKPKP